MEDYARISLETNLFFARIMKEHSLFLEAGFLEKDENLSRRAAWFRREFEDLLRRTVEISNGMVSMHVLESEELVTPFTLAAEEKTESLSGIPINRRITRMTEQLRAGCALRVTREQLRMIEWINRRALRLLEGLIAFKEELLERVRSCRLFTANYPLLIEHILREARLYRDTLRELMGEGGCDCERLRSTEAFWNQIMMEHALFIRGLLDPTEEKLIQTADGFAKEFRLLLERARTQDFRVQSGLTRASLEETKKLKEFKTAGTKGILECQIQSLLLPLLADHVLREANHYIRILEHGYDC